MTALYGALPLRYAGFFGDPLGIRTRISIFPKSRVTDRCLNHYTTASLQRISLKRRARCPYTNEMTHARDRDLGMLVDPFQQQRGVALQRVVAEPL